MHRQRSLSPTLLATVAACTTFSAEPTAIAQDASPAKPVSKREANAEAIASSRALIEEYYELQRQVATSEANWRVDKEILKGRSELLTIELTKLSESTKEQEAKITETDEERTKLADENDQLEAARSLQLDALEKMEKRVRELAKAFPKPLAEKLSPILERLPAPDKKREEIAGALATRFTTVLAILDEVHRFDSEITVTPETRSLEDGRKIEVQTLYLGLAQAFYAGSGESEDIAGVGVPSQSGWEWREMPDRAEDISTIIKQYSGETPAAFVPVPVTLQP